MYAPLGWVRIGSVNASLQRYGTLDSAYGPLIPNVNLWVVYEKFNAVWRDRTYQIDW